MHAYENLGGALCKDPGTLAYIDKWHENVIDAHPGDAPLGPEVPTLIELSPEAPFTRRQVEDFHAPLAVFAEEMTTHHAAYKRWDRRNKRYESLRLQVARVMYIGFIILNNSNVDRFGDLKSLLEAIIFP